MFKIVSVATCNCGVLGLPVEFRPNYAQTKDNV